jgi:aspartate oxidase
MEKTLAWMNGIISSLEEAELRDVKDMETLNIAYIASLILKSAIARRKNCGSHYRTDSE